MKTLLCILVPIILSSCGTMPVDVQYHGSAVGHDYTVAYGTATGIKAEVSQK